MNEVKPYVQSKTLWFNAVLTLLGTYYPPIHDWVFFHPQEVLAVMGVMNMILRIISTKVLG